MPHGSIGFTLVDAGYSVSYYPSEQGIEIREDDKADTLIALSAENWWGIVKDLETAPALIYGGRLSDGCRGDVVQFMHWEPMLRSLYTGLPLYPADHALLLTDQGGEALNLLQRFTLERDDMTQMRHYLNTTGYLLLGDVFGEAEVKEMVAAGDTLRHAATEDDQSSWWGKDREGNAIVTRVLNGGEHPYLHALASDPRIAAMQSLMPPGLKGENPDDIDAVTVLFKTPEMVEGLSDLPWHRDCGMGGHAVMCPVINLSIYLADATPASGELRFLPGSHRYATPNPGEDDGISIPAKAGDVTLHFGDVMHGAPAPQGTTGPFRSSILLSFKPDFENHRGDRHYNDVLLDDGDGFVSALPGK